MTVYGVVVDGRLHLFTEYYKAIEFCRESFLAIDYDAHVRGFILIEEGR